MKEGYNMPGRDWDSIQRDISRAIKSTIFQFQQHDLPIEAGPIVEVALAMFKRYRDPTIGDIIEKITGAMMELFLLYVDRCYEKEDGKK
jgi:hypothetical protein